MRYFLILLAGSLFATCSDPAPGPPAVEAADPLLPVQRLYEAAAGGDNAVLNELLGDHVEWVEAEGGPFEAGNPYRGLGEVGAGVFGPIAEQYADFRVTPARFLVGTDGRVLAEGRYTGTHRVTGEALDAPFAHVFTVDGDRITHYQQYTDTYQWRSLEARAEQGE